MTKKVVKLAFPKSGRPLAIYSPDAEKLLSGLGELSISRASNVEPGSGLSADAKIRLLADGRWSHSCKTKWFADLLPVRGPVLGPFATRDEALAAELEYFNANLMRIANDYDNNNS